MWRYLVRRAFMMIPVLFIVSLLSFFGMQLVPGDPIYAILGPELVELDAAQIAALRAEHGLDRPLPVRYATWLADLVRGDFGISIRSDRPVLTIILERLSVSIWLTATTLVMNVVMGVVLGVVAGVYAGGKIDFLLTVIAAYGVATPSFWMAIMFIMIFALTLGWFPASGWVSPLDDPVRGAKHLALPVLALGLFGSASVMRQTRSAMIEVLSQDYIRTARAKGLSRRSIIVAHALRNALIPIVTVAAFQLSNLVGGSVLVERVFAIPGAGRLIVDATIALDYPVIQAFVLLTALAVVAANFLADIAYAVIDPRVRYN